MKYDYREHIKADVLDSLDLFDMTEYDSADELYEAMYDELFDEDSVTGNASGSYTFDRAEAKENVVANIDILHDAAEDGFIEAEEIGKKFMAEEWEFFDVLIRCYLLSSVCYEVAEEKFNEK